MRIKIEAKHIPDGTIVRKANGRFTFTLRKNIKVYDTYNTFSAHFDGNAPKEITLPKDSEVNYLVNARGDISVVNSSKCLEVDIVDGQFDLLQEIYESKFGKVSSYE